MATENSTLKIKAKRLGTVKEVKQLLTDFENAYNSIYAFDFLVDTLSNDRDRRLRLLGEKLHNWGKYWEEFTIRKGFPYDPFMFEFFWDLYLHRTDESTISLLELQSKIDIDKIVLPADKLTISKVNIQSPGFWEFLGSLNPLQQIREYLKDRHDRQKDKKYRSRQEEELGDLSIMEKKNNIIKQRIEILRGLGYSETEIRQLVMTMVIEPLNKLGGHIDNGQIDGLEE
jgi:hypothetical protein